MNKRALLMAGGAGVLGAGVALLILGPRLGYHVLKKVKAQRGKRLEGWNLNRWIRIDSSGAVTVFVNKSDMGQGVFTALPMILNEELDADWARISVAASPSGDGYADPVWGMQLTGGSTSVMHMFDPLRKAGAAAREMLVSAAAEIWRVDRSRCSARAGTVYDKETGATLSYGELARKAATLTPPERPSLKHPDRYTLIGTSPQRLDIPTKVHSTALFGIDVSIPGTVYADVARPPAYGAEPVSYDKEAALKVEGVYGVVPIERGIAVTARSINAVWKGKKALSVKWSAGSDPGMSTGTLKSRYLEYLDRPGQRAKRVGEAETALSKAAKRVEAIYRLPFLAHVCMEPMNCTAHVRESGCDLWVPTQNQTGCIQAATRITGLSPEQVRVHTTYLGGGFGRRGEVDYAEEAIRISKETGMPVKLIWSREDDVKSDFFRPGNVCRIRGGLDGNGRLIAWSHKVVCGPVWMAGVEKGAVDPNAIDGILHQYEVPNLEIVYVDPEVVIPTGFWRSVGNSQNAFTVESFMDELAHAAGRDPLEFRLELLEKVPAARRVLETAAEKAGWGKPPGEGKALGLAYHYSFGSHVAHVAEVSVNPEKGEVRVHKVVSVVDCGPAVNPAIIRAQIRGGVVMGLSAALHEEVKFAEGGVETSNFDDYPILRMKEAPTVEVHILESEEPIGGIGEPGLPPIAPAVANGVFRAIGVRVRELPIRAI